MIIDKPKKVRALIAMPFVLGLFVTPIFLKLAIVSSGAGHGSYNFAIALFPFSMIIGALAKHISNFAIAIGVIQWPLYGLALSISLAKCTFKESLLTLIVAHVVGVAVFYLVGNSLL